MPFFQSGGASAITGASVVDGSLSEADMAASSKNAYIMTSALTVLPLPNFRSVSGSSIGVSGNTTLFLGQQVVTARITVNKVSFNVNGHTAAGTIKFAIFSEDGQTQLISFTSSTISGTGQYIHTLGSPVDLPAGIYYVAILPVSTVNINIPDFRIATQEYSSGVTGEPQLAGTLTVTADTMPTTISPTSISFATDASAQIRLDN